MFSSTTSARSGLVIVATLLGCGATDVAPAPRVLELTGPTMGTSFLVKIVTDNLDLDESALRTAVVDELDGVDVRMSTWRDDSDLSRFNASTQTTAQVAHPDLLEVLGMASDVAAASAGAFDVTVGPLVDLWGFGPRDAPDAPPDQDRIDALRDAVGHELLEVDLAAATVAKHSPELRVDLSAIAKGYGVDRVAGRLESMGFERFMVEVGGEVYASGQGPEGPWRIAIEHPRAERLEAHRVVSPDGWALATSGDYRNFWEHGGVRYSHTIDPRSGRPVTHALVSASVAHRSCTLADAWATAMMVLGPDDGLALAEDLDLAVLLLSRIDGELVEQMSIAFARRIDPPGLE
ncbi:MAG: FAD:protein FMN transferase [Acidobacteriota bacterium]|nr:FAD:protein FMN transferase [Acidobacteriota bacterium]